MADTIQTPTTAAEAAGRAAAQQAQHSAARAPTRTGSSFPVELVFTVFFVVPSVIAFYFSLTRWTLFDQEFIGLDNYRQFFAEPALVSGLTHTLIYAVVTCGLKVVIGMSLAVLLTGPIIGRGFMRTVAFFPVLVSTVGIGLDVPGAHAPDRGRDQPGPRRRRHLRTRLAGGPAVGAALGGVRRRLEGRRTGDRHLHGRHPVHPQGVLRGRQDRRSGAWQRFWNITLPLAKPATISVIILSLIGGLRSFDLIWAMTKGGPGFTSDVLASVVYKQYQAGFYGLSTAGNVVLFLLVIVIVLPAVLVPQP